MRATPWCALGLLAVPLALRAAGPVRRGRGGRDLIPVLRDTGLTMLVWSVAVASALRVGRSEPVASLLRLSSPRNRACNCSRSRRRRSSTSAMPAVARRRSGASSQIPSGSEITIANSIATTSGNP